MKKKVRMLQTTISCPGTADVTSIFQSMNAPTEFQVRFYLPGSDGNNQDDHVFVDAKLTVRYYLIAHVTQRVRKCCYKQEAHNGQEPV